jgi:hypothetical protein
VTDLSQTIAPKSDQLNADDLIGRTMTITVSKISKADGEQPVAINFEGDGGKPYKPCESMRRVLVNVWGADGHAYAGRRMTLYRDDTVAFGGMAVGGIRISHVSDTTKPVTMALTATRAQRKPYTVKPLPAEQAPKSEPDQQQAPKRTKADLFADARARAAEGSFALDQWRAALPDRARTALDEISDELTAAAETADAQADDDHGSAEAA